MMQNFDLRNRRVPEELGEPREGRVPTLFQQVTDKFATLLYRAMA